MKKFLLCFFGIVAIFSFAMIIIKIIFPSYNYLFGSWSIDNTTYTFQRNKQGTLNINDLSYEFKYSIENNKICLDFTDNDLEDKCYQFSYENDNLILKDDNNTFIFNK